MAKVLTARGTDGLVAIHEPDANIENPIGNLNKIYFHSGLNYLSINFYKDVNLNTATAGNFPLFAHGKNRPVMFLPIRMDTQDVMGGTCVIASANQTATCITFNSDNLNINARIHGARPVNRNVPIRIYVFDNPIF